MCAPNQKHAYINKLIRQPLQRQLAPPREAGKQSREPYSVLPVPVLAIRAFARLVKHVLFQALEEYLRRPVQRHLKHPREIRRRQNIPRLLEQSEKWRVEEPSVVWGGRGHEVASACCDRCAVRLGVCGQVVWVRRDGKGGGIFEGEGEL